MSARTKTLDLGSITLTKGSKVSDKGNVTVHHDRKVKVFEDQPITVQLTVWTPLESAKKLGLAPGK